MALASDKLNILAPKYFNGRRIAKSSAGRGPHLEKVPASTLKDKQDRGRPAMGPNDSMAGVSLEVIKFFRGLKYYYLTLPQSTRQLDRYTILNILPGGNPYSGILRILHWRIAPRRLLLSLRMLSMDPFMP